VPTSAQVCAKLPLPAMMTLTSDKWASAAPSDGLIGCTLMSPDPASLYVRLDDAATKAPDQTRAAAFAKTFFESETSVAAYQSVPGVGDEAKFRPRSCDLHVLTGALAWDVQLLSHTGPDRCLELDKQIYTRASA